MTPAYLLPPLAGQYAAFLRTIAAAPDCDTPRLVLADWLEEHAGTVRATCGRCGSLGWIVYGSGLTPALKKVPCPDCEGEGSRLVSNGCGERADFIRVQCELARLEAIGVDHCKALVADPGRDASEPDGHEKERIALRTRERELFDQFGGAWFALPGRTVVWGDTHAITFRWEAPERGVPPIEAEVRRGFIDTVRGPLAALLGEPCGRCDGTGRPIGADRPFEWSADPDYNKCVICHGTGRTPGALERMGPELLAVTRVEVADREPWTNLDRTHWGWWERTIHTGPDTLSPAVMDAMDDDPRRRDYGIGVARRKGRPTPGGCVLFRTETAARDALSHAVLALARRRAGLECEPVDPVPAS